MASPAPHPAPSSQPGRERVVVLDVGSLAALAASVAVTAAAVGILRSAPRTLTGLAIAAMVAIALSSPVRFLQERAHLSRPWAVTAVVSGLALVMIVALGVLVPPALSQARRLPSEAPRVVRDLGRLPLIGPTLRANQVPAKIQRGIEDLPNRLRGDLTPLQRAGKSVADGALAATAMWLLALALLLDGPRLLGAARRLVPPRFLPETDRAAALAYQAVGRYLAGSLLVAAICGVVVLVTGLALGIPLTPLAAVWVAVWDLVPQIGGAAGGIPFVLLALTKGAGTAALAAGIFLVYLQIENHILGPLLVGRSVKLSPPATMTAALIGVAAGGVVGALLAVPLVGATKAVYLDLRGQNPDGEGEPVASGSRGG